MMIRRGDRKYREFECSQCEIKRHIYEIERGKPILPDCCKSIRTQNLSLHIRRKVVTVTHILS